VSWHQRARRGAAPSDLGAGKEGFKPTATSIVLAGILVALIAGVALLAKRMEHVAQQLSASAAAKTKKD